MIYKKIDGTLTIYKPKDGYVRVNVGSRRLIGDDYIELKVRTLKQIISDAKRGII